jgi:hypothetical protein
MPLFSSLIRAFIKELLRVKILIFRNFHFGGLPLVNGLFTCLNFINNAQKYTTT